MECHCCCKNRRKIHHPDQILCQNDLKIGMRIKRMYAHIGGEEIFTVLSLPYLDEVSGKYYYKIDLKEATEEATYFYVSDMGIEPYLDGHYNPSNYTILLKDVEGKHCHCHCHCHHHCESC